MENMHTDNSCKGLKYEIRCPEGSRQHIYKLRKNKFNKMYSDL